MSGAFSSTSICYAVFVLVLIVLSGDGMGDGGGGGGRGGGRGGSGGFCPTPSFVL